MTEFARYSGPGPHLWSASTTANARKRRSLSIAEARARLNGRARSLFDTTDIGRRIVVRKPSEDVVLGIDGKPVED